MAISSVPPQKPYSTHIAAWTQGLPLVPGSAFWRCCIPGDKTFIIIHTSTASSFQAAECTAASVRSDPHHRRQFLFPVKVLSRVFRANLIAYLKTAFRDGKLGFHGELKCLGEKRKFIEWVKLGEQAPIG